MFLCFLEGEEGSGYAVAEVLPGWMGISVGVVGVGLVRLVYSVVSLL